MGGSITCNLFTSVQQRKSMEGRSITTTLNNINSNNNNKNNNNNNNINKLHFYRWIKLRSSLVPFTILLEPISEWLLQGLTSSWCVWFLFSWSPLAFFLVHSLIWFLLDYVLLVTVQVLVVYLCIFLCFLIIIRNLSKLKIIDP